MTALFYCQRVNKSLLSPVFIGYFAMDNETIEELSQVGVEYVKVVIAPHDPRAYLMCQHFSGHIIKQLYAAFQILPATGSHC